MQGFPVQASCRQSASTASPFARKLVPNTLAAQVDVCATEITFEHMHSLPLIAY
jgi:hypothetical protein